MKKAFSILILFISYTLEAHLSEETDVRKYELASMRGVTLNTDDDTNCAPDKLVGFIDELRTRFGNVEITSGLRSTKHNRQVGGARRSQHLSCNALDFKVPDVPRSEVKQFLAAKFMGRAGIGFYCNNEFHLDIGKPREWGGCQPTKKEIALAKSKYPRTDTIVSADLQTSTDSLHSEHHEATLQTVVQ